MSARVSDYGCSISSIDMKLYPDDQLLKIIKDAASPSIPGDHLLGSSMSSIWAMFRSGCLEMSHSLFQILNLLKGFLDVA